MASTHVCPWVGAIDRCHLPSASLFPQASVADAKVAGRPRCHVCPNASPSRCTAQPNPAFAACFCRLLLPHKILTASHSPPPSLPTKSCQIYTSVIITLTRLTLTFDTSWKRKLKHDPPLPQHPHQMCSLPHVLFPEKVLST